MRRREQHFRHWGNHCDPDGRYHWRRVPGHKHCLSACISVALNLWAAMYVMCPLFKSLFSRKRCEDLRSCNFVQLPNQWLQLIAPLQPKSIPLSSFLSVHPHPPLSFLPLANQRYGWYTIRTLFFFADGQWPEWDAESLYCIYCIRIRSSKVLVKILTACIYTT